MSVAESEMEMDKTPTVKTGGTVIKATVKTNHVRPRGKRIEVGPKK